MSQVSQTVVDPVTMTVTANYLVTVTREMGQAMQNTAYSPIFNEALDFSCAVFDEEGEMIGQGEFCPAQLGATTMALRWIIDEFGLDALEPGDVFLHNDPYSGMNHLPEHMVVKAVFCDGQRVESSPASVTWPKWAVWPPAAFPATPGKSSMRGSGFHRSSSSRPV